MIPVSGNLFLVGSGDQGHRTLARILTLPHDHGATEMTIFQVAGMTLIDSMSGPHPLRLCRLFIGPEVCLYLYPYKILSSVLVIQSIGCCRCELSRGETNPLVGGVEYRIETFKEGKAIDKVKTFTGRCSKVSDNEINIVRGASNNRIESTGPCLRVSSEFKCRLKDYLRFRTRLDAYELTPLIEKKRLCRLAN